MNSITFQIANTIRALLDAKNIIMNHPAVQSALAVHDAGSDFADTIMDFEGQPLGADTFVSFDHQAVKLLSGQGVSARLLQ